MNIKVLKAATPRPDQFAVQLQVSAASAETEFTVWPMAQTSWPKHGNAAETAFVEPFWRVKRLPSNDPLKEKNEEEQEKEEKRAKKEEAASLDEQPNSGSQASELHRR